MSSIWDSEEIIGEVERTKKEKIVVKKVSQKGVFKIDFRTYYKSDEGDYRPSTKGFVLPIEKKEELVNLINSIEV